MNAVVSNSGPLIALSSIGQSRLLQGLFGEVMVAPAVCLEVQAGGKTGAGSSLCTTESWLHVKQLIHPVDPLLTAVLDAGEAATIALATQESAALVVMDEAKGRRVARDIYGLQVIGTGRVLVESKRAGLITEVRGPIEQLRSKGYWMSNAIIAEILRQAGE